MLPVAPTCSLWWVARWTARMLTSLAVAVAFSLSAGSLSFDPAPPAGADAAGRPAPAWPLAASLSLVGASDLGSAPACPLAAGPRLVGASDLGPATAAGMRAVGPGRAAVDVPAASAHPDAVLAGSAGRSVVDQVPAHRMPVGPAPTTAGSRAPPRG
ncbi:hypothetical protein ACH4OY_27320 [Micromonospora rubida]|uniref:Uncharacterized protein n=1 Tax=Micromonospora rubida TaxID=2697657 RepID=A0ABW7SV56_9ACTN